MEEVAPFSSTYCMTSFDIQSLFTYTPLQETVSICVDKLFHNEAESTTYLKNLLNLFLELGILNSLFIFAGKYYKQIEEVAMGSPLCLTSGNVVCHFEEWYMFNCPND